jgi:nicotinate phosphoribosyltransferase
VDSLGLWVGDENLALATDLYQLTMAAAYYSNGMHVPATFELFVRQLPPQRGYLIAAGLQQALHALTAMRFGADQIEWLRGLPVFKHVDRRFFDYLARWRFGGDVWAMPEGTPVFAGEPILRVTAPIIEAQVVETILLTTIAFQTLVATKAARIVEAAAGRSVVDFGTRRAHGPQAGVLAARAAAIGGCTGTSNLLAARALGLPAVGTCAHSWVMAFDDEAEAFRKFRRVYPEQAVLLVDTYDTIEGLRKAIRTGAGLAGVRIDSGDLAAVSRQARQILDETGLRHVQIVASSDLNEYKIADLVSAGAPIDVFGVGTEMATSRDEPALGAVYKVVDVNGIGKVKESPGKETLPGAKQVFRGARQDWVGAADETLPGRPLLEPVLRGGAPLGPPPSLEELRARARAGRESLPEAVRRFRDPQAYPVEFSERLRAERRRLIDRRPAS